MLTTSAILFVVKGEQKIAKYDGVDLVVNENEMVLLPKDLYVVSDFVTKQSNFIAYIFFIDDSVINQFLLLQSQENDVERSENQVLKATMSVQVNQFINSLGDVYLNHKNSGNLSDIKILEFLLLLEQQGISGELLTSLVKAIKKRSIIKFMEENYLTNLKVSDYALLTGRSISTFNRDFKRLYNTTPKKWLIQKKIHESHQLIINTNLNVTEVSAKVGYENVSHFIVAYKNIYGITPKSAINAKK